FVRRALRVEFSPAIKALAAGDVVETDGAVARLPAGDSAADVHHGSRHFVPKNLGRAHEAVMDFLDVRAAHAARCHPQQHLARADFRHRYVFHGHPARSEVDSRAHVSPHWAQAVAARARAPRRFHGTPAHACSTATAAYPFHASARSAMYRSKNAARLADAL